MVTVSSSKKGIRSQPPEATFQHEVYDEMRRADSEDCPVRDGKQVSSMHLTAVSRGSVSARCSSEGPASTCGPFSPRIVGLPPLVATGDG
jgi:hypothetical protein